MLTLQPKLLYLNNSSSTNWPRQALYVAAPEVFDESTVSEVSGAYEVGRGKDWHSVFQRCK